MKREDFIKHFSKKSCLGDSVYIHFDGYHFILETWNGYDYDQRNRIGLEPQVIQNLLSYRKNVYAEAENITDE